MNIKDQLKLNVMKNLHDVDAEILEINKTSRKTAIIPGHKVLEEVAKNMDVSSDYYNYVEHNVIKTHEETKKLKELYIKRDSLINVLKNPEDFMTLVQTTVDSLIKFVNNMEEL